MVKRGLTRGKRFCHGKRPGTDSLKGREGLGRAGWGKEVSGRGQKNRTGKGQQAQTSAKQLLLPLTELLQVLMHYMSFLLKSIAHLSANLHNIIYLP